MIVAGGHQTGSVDELGLLYARTIPLETLGTVAIVIQLSAPFVLYATKQVTKAVLAHEFLHYVDLVGRLTTFNIASDPSSSSVFEERYADMERVSDASVVFEGDKKLISLLKKKMTAGLSDEKLNQKCQKQWIEKKLPVFQIPISANQTRLSVDSVMRSHFDPKIKKIFNRVSSSYSSSQFALVEHE